MFKKNEHEAEAKKQESAQEKQQKTTKKKGKSKRKSTPHVHVHIHAGYNNTIVSITEPNGEVLAWASAGSCGFKGARKSTPYASQVAAENAVEKAKVFGIEKADVFLRGVGPGREQCIRGLIQAGLSIESIVDITPIAHNGTRKARVRRV